MTGSSSLCRRRAAVITVAAITLLLGMTAAASAIIVQQRGVRVKVDAKMRPTRLPRVGLAPIAVSLGGAIFTPSERHPPALKSISIEINRHGRLDYQGLPTCEIGRIEPASSSAALAACRPALVGRGRFSGTISLPGAEPYLVSGLLLIFNAREHHHEVLYVHAYSDKPFATSFVMRFRLSKIAHGTYGTALTANLTKTLGKKRSLSKLEMTLSRRYSVGGRRHSFLSAGCPAPKGLRVVVFPLARTSFTFAGRKPLVAAVPRTCKALSGANRR
jgi:hypothetical protein